MCNFHVMLALLGFWVTVTPRPKLVSISVSFKRPGHCIPCGDTVTDKLYFFIKEILNLTRPVKVYMHHHVGCTKYET